MEISELDTLDALEDSKPWWNSLLSKSLDNNVFLTHEWLTEWWKHFGNGRTLGIFIGKENGQVHFAAPMMYSTYKLLGIKLRKLEFIATPFSDYNVFLVINRESATKAAKLLLERVRESFAQVDCVELEEVPEDSCTVKILENIKTDGLKTCSNVVSICPYIILPNCFETFLQHLGPNMRRNLKRWEKKALEDHNVDFVTYDEVGGVKEAMNIFYELHQKRWASKHEPGIFTQYVNRDFHLQVAQNFAEKKQLALFFLRFGGEPISAVYSYEYNGKLYVYQSGFDPEYEEYHPGYLTFNGLMKYAVEKGLREFDFMRGNEEYKTRWKTQMRRNLEFRALNRSCKATLYNWFTNNKSLSNLCAKIGKKVCVEGANDSSLSA